jgi:dipeptidyl aminopeptidase/acylaminoacyl peptidase
VQPRDLEKIRFLSDPRLHGDRVVFTVARINLEDDRYESQVWLWDGSRAAPFTGGRHDSAPRWSPDGSRLAFLRKGPDEKDKPQVAVIPAGGGEARVITDFALGASDIAWSPDGTRLAVVATEWTEEWKDLDDDERARKPRMIDRLDYRGDTRGMLDDRRSHVYLVDPDGKQDVADLTPDDFHSAGPAWHPDGKSVAFLSARHEDRDLGPGGQVWRVGVEGGDAEAVTDIGYWGFVTYRPDGVMHIVGLPGLMDYPDVMPLWRVEPDGARTNLTGKLDRNIMSHSPSIAPAGPQWLDDGVCYTTVEDAGRIRAVAIDLDGMITDLAGGDRVITGLSPRSDGSAFAFVAASPTDPGELCWWENGTERKLTKFNEEFRTSVPLISPEPFTVSHEGIEVEGWVYLPPGEDTVPLLLNIHGGPASMYSLGFFDEFQVYATAGYGVVATNPRGSTSYGSDHVRAVVGTWAGDNPPDLRDVRAAVGVALERFPRLDPNRMGVMGGSYGGYMTVRVLADDDRYRSAVAERGLHSWLSFAGTSDIGAYFDRMYLEAGLPADVEGLWQASPVAWAPRVTTPTLVLHSESDYRCPIEQGEQLFAALRRNGTKTAMLRFPGESHELSRSGKPKHRVERFEAILAWHAEHLVAG